VLRRFGLPGYFIKVLMRLHFGEGDSEVDSAIGVRQGSCEGPVLFLFVIQAAMKTPQWPGGVARPEGTLHPLSSGPPSSRAILRSSSTHVIASSRTPTKYLLSFKSLIFKCTLVVAPRHPKPRRYTFHLHVKGRAQLWRFVEFRKSFKYVGSITHYFLTSDAGVFERIISATAALGALNALFGDKYLSEKFKK
jgi:hypothetical protein